MHPKYKGKYVDPHIPKTICPHHCNAFLHELALLTQRLIVNDRRAWLMEMIQKQPKAPPPKRMQCEYIDLYTETKCKTRSKSRAKDTRITLCKTHRIMMQAELKKLETSGIVNARRTWIEETLNRNTSRHYSVGNGRTQAEKRAASIYWCKDCGKT